MAKVSSAGTVYRLRDPKTKKVRPTWWVQFVDPQGRRVRESSGSTVKADATALLKQRIGEIATHTYVGPEAERATFEDLMDAAEQDYRLQGHRSLKRVGQARANLARTFGGMAALRITADRLVAYHNTRTNTDKAARATVAYELAILRRAFTLAVKHKRLQTRPVFPEQKHLNANRRVGFFEEADFRLVLAELPEYLKSLMTVGFLTGWRVRDELCTLTWDQVDLQAGTMRLERSKNGKPRIFPIHADPELVEVFQRQREVTDQTQRRTGRIIPLVFHHDGRPIVNYYKAWHKACRAAAVLKDAEGKPVERDGKVVIARPHLLGRIPHDFRRSACRRLVQGGIPEQVAMKLVGWESRQMLDRYFIIDEGDLGEAVAKIAALRTAKPAQKAQRDVLTFPKEAAG